MSSRLLSFVIWAAVAASAAFWGLRLFTRTVPAPAHAQAVALAAPAATGDLTRLLGVAPVAVVQAAPVPVADSRFKLVGVVAPRGARSANGLALISVDGKPAKPHAVGAPVDGSLVLQSVGHRRAELGTRGGAAQVTLELPMVPEPSRAVRMPSADALSGAVPGMPPDPNIPPPMVAPAPGAPGAPGALPPVAPRTAPMPAPPSLRPRLGQGAAS
jgi:general secretion pathway protein C